MVRLLSATSSIYLVFNPNPVSQSFFSTPPVNWSDSQREREIFVHCQPSLTHKHYLETVLSSTDFSVKISLLILNMFGKKDLFICFV